MPLVLALKNRDTVVVGTDAHAMADGTLEFGQMMNVPGQAIILMAGNIEAIRRPIVHTVIPKLSGETSAATLAQLIHAALVLETVPQLTTIPGRIEVIVAGIDPVRHIREPNLYYMDSAEDFYLKMIVGDFVAAGSTAAVGEVLEGQDLKSAAVETLNNLVKDCLATTKMRWPAALGTHQRLGMIAPHQTKILSY